MKRSMFTVFTQREGGRQALWDPLRGVAVCFLGALACIGRCRCVGRWQVNPFGGRRVSRNTPRPFTSHPVELAFIYYETWNQNGNMQKLSCGRVDLLVRSTFSIPFETLANHEYLLLVRLWIHIKRCASELCWFPKIALAIKGSYVYLKRMPVVGSASELESPKYSYRFHSIPIDSKVFL